MFHFDLLDVIFWAVKIVIASYVIRWAWREVISDWFPRGFQFPRIHFGKHQALPPAPEPEPKAKRSRKRVRVEPLKEEKAFHVGSVDGRDVIVVADDDNDAQEVGSKALGVSKKDVVSAQVYDKVVRK